LFNHFGKRFYTDRSNTTFARHTGTDGSSAATPHRISDSAWCKKIGQGCNNCGRYRIVFYQWLQHDWTGKESAFMQLPESDPAV